MSNHMAIATVTAALSRLLQARVGAEVPGALTTTVRPDGAGGVPDTGVNIFLYQVTPNPHLIQNDLPTRRTEGGLVQRPQIAIDLHYLLSFYGAEAELEPQRLLGGTLLALHVQPFLTRQDIVNTVNAEGYLSGSDLAEQVEQVKFSPLSLNLEEMSKLWSVFFQTPYVLSVAYQASAVLITSDQRPVPSQPVLEPVIQAVPSVAAGRTPAVSPETLDGLQLWFRADRDFIHDDLGFVSQWGDRSGNDRHGFQNVDARRPTLVRKALNGKSVMRFDGADDYLAIDAMKLDTAGQISGITIFALVKSASTNNQIIASFDRSEYWRFALHNASAGGAGWQTRASGGVQHDLFTPDPCTDGRWHLIACRFEAGASPDKRIFVDGEEVASADAHAGESLGSGTPRFGFIGVGSEAATVGDGIGPAHFLDGDLAEFIIYNRALSDAERRGIERYIVETYGS